jgi:protein phosphatase
MFVRPNRSEVLISHGVLALVADGMGGHKAGEHASSLAAGTVARAYFDSGELPQDSLAAALQKANRAVYEAALDEPAWKGMGTTCVAVSICGEHAYWAWVGDSRLYLLRGDKSFRLTEDHTVVQDMVRRGWMTQEEARAHQDRNVLERAIGTRATVEVGVGGTSMRLECGDRLLLCSDGLHDLLSDDEMALSAIEGTASACADRLLQTALERGAPDNVSIVLLDARPEGTARPPIRTREHLIA